ncbi:MAG: helix-turn-helix transcriptional regulator [Bacillota bacterium]
MKLRLTRKRKGYRQSDLAEALDTNTMVISLLENYDVIPTPQMMIAMEEALGTNRLEIYDRKELQLLKSKNNRFDVPDDYPHFHIHVRLPRKLKKLLCKANFRRAGYRDMNHWFMRRVRDFALRLGYINEYFDTKEKNAQTGRVDAFNGPIQSKEETTIIIHNPLNNDKVVS